MTNLFNVPMSEWDIETEIIMNCAGPMLRSGQSLMLDITRYLWLLTMHCSVLFSDTRKTI